MTKSKKYRKKPRGYKRKLANAPHLYNRQEPPRFGYAYNRSNTGDPFINSFHQGNRRYQDREKFESLKRLKNREGIQTGLMAENFKKIESAYYSSTAVADRITTGLKGIEDEVKGLNNQALRHVPAMAPGGGPFLAAPVLPPPPGRTGSRFLNRFRAPGPPRPPGGAPLCIWAGGRSQGEVLAEVILVLEFLDCESTAAVLVVVTDTGRKS